MPPERSGLSVDLPADWVESDLTARLQQVLTAAEQARQGLARRLALSGNEVSAMEHLMGEPLGPADLSRRLGITTASATALVDRLEAAGHLVREADPHDRRRKVLRPTPGGAAAVFAQVGPLVGGLLAAESGMSDADRRVVGEYLVRVHAALVADAQR
jgi:DNA-binding MarR family transcriptional regulator